MSYDINYIIWNKLGWKRIKNTNGLEKKEKLKEMMFLITIE